MLDEVGGGGVGDNHIHLCTRGAACSNSRPQPGAKTFRGLEGGEGGGGGWWVGRQGPHGGGGSVGTPTYIPQNDPHDALVSLNIHNWG